MPQFLIRRRCIDAATGTEADTYLTKKGSWSVDPVQARLYRTAVFGALEADRFQAAECVPVDEVMTPIPRGKK